MKIPYNTTVWHNAMLLPKSVVIPPVSVGAGAFSPLLSSVPMTILYFTLCVCVCVAALCRLVCFVHLL